VLVGADFARGGYPRPKRWQRGEERKDPLASCGTCWERAPRIHEASRSQPAKQWPHHSVVISRGTPEKGYGGIPWRRGSAPTGDAERRPRAREAVEVLQAFGVTHASWKEWALRSTTLSSSRRALSDTRPKLLGGLATDTPSILENPGYPLPAESSSNGLRTRLLSAQSLTKRTFLRYPPAARNTQHAEQVSSG